MRTSYFNINPEVIEWTDFFYQILEQSAIPTFLTSIDKSTKTCIELDGEDFIVDSVHLVFPHKQLNKFIRDYIDPKNKLYFKNLNFEVDITLIPDMLFSLDYYNGYYNEHNAEYYKRKLRNAELYFDIYLPYSVLKDYDGVMNDYNINSKLYEIISHEMDHAYEFLDKRKGGDTPIFPDRLKNFLICLNRQNHLISLSPDWERFLNLCYYNLSFERNARVTQLCYSLTDHSIDNEEDLLTFIEDSDPWKEMIQLRDFDSDEFYENFTIDASEEDLKESFLTNGIYTEEDFLKNDVKTLVLRYFLTEWNKNIDIVNDEFLIYGDLILRKLPEKALEEPKSFFEYYEKIFTINWFYFYDKVEKILVK